MKITDGVGAEGSLRHVSRLLGYAQLVHIGRGHARHILADPVGHDPFVVCRPEMSTQFPNVNSHMPFAADLVDCKRCRPAIPDIQVGSFIAVRHGEALMRRVGRVVSVHGNGACRVRLWSEPTVGELRAGKGHGSWNQSLITVSPDRVIGPATNPAVQS